MSVIVILKGEKVAESKNLAAWTRYASKSPVYACYCHDVESEKGAGYQATLYFENGAASTALWQSPDILGDWLANRVSWGAIAVYGNPLTVVRYQRRKGDSAMAALYRQLLADMVSECSRSGSGNPWRMAAMKRACLQLTGHAIPNVDDIDWTVAHTSPMERKARAAHYDY
jgi:hypothetical protein